MTLNQPSRTTRRSVVSMLGIAPLAAGLSGSVALAAPAEAASSGRIPDGLKPGGELDRFVASQAAKDAFSGSLLLTYRGRTVLARSYGLADKSKSVLNGPNTRFDLASVTKLFTGVAVAQLVQAGSLAYGDKVSKHLDGFPASVGDTVRIHHLLTHTSGLGDYMSLPGFFEAAAKWTSAEETMAGTTAFIKKMTPEFPAGAGLLYSNAAYHLLGEIIVKVSGVSYYDYVQKNVFGRTGMRGSGFFEKSQRLTDRTIAHPYYRPSEGADRIDSLDEQFFIGTPAGGAFSTCADLDRFGRALIGEQLLNAGHTQLLLGGKVPLGSPRSSDPSAPPVIGFQFYGGIGTLINGHLSYGMNGGMSTGASTSVEFHPERGWNVVVLSNYEPEAAAGQVASLARKLIVS